MKQTAIEWFDEQLQDKMYVQYGYSDGVRKIVIPIEDYMKLKQEAKEMEKEQIKDAWINSLTKGDYNSADEYYNETFKS